MLDGFQSAAVSAPVTLGFGALPRRDHTLLHFVAREVARHCGDAAPGLRAALPSAPAAARTSTAALQARCMGQGAPQAACVLSCGCPASIAASLQAWLVARRPVLQGMTGARVARTSNTAHTHRQAQACE
jgi:hypothetical protein